MSTASTLLDHAELIEALNHIIERGTVFEVRCLDATTTGDRWPKTWHGYFDDPEKAAKALNSIRSAKGIYFTPNPADPALLARANNRLKQSGKRDAATNDTNIARRRWLLIDTDAERPAGISATNAEHDAALRLARDIRDGLKDWPQPILADSGNGGHLLYRIDLGGDDGGVVERVLQSLAVTYKREGVKVDTSVFNPSRIWKLYGTRACKGDSTDDRPHRMARLIDVPDELHAVPVELLEAEAKERQRAGGASKVNQKIDEPQSTERAAQGNGTRFDVPAFIDRHGIDAEPAEPYSGKLGTGTRWKLNSDPMDNGHDDGSCFIIQKTGGMVCAGSLHESARWGWRDLREKYEPKASRNGTPSSSPDIPPDELIVRRAADIDTRPINWFWHQRIPSGSPSLIMGMPNQGKSTLTTDIVARVTTGTPWPVGENPAIVKGSAVILTAEESAEQIVVPRLHAAMADLDKVHLLEGVSRMSGKERYRDSFDISRDVERLEALADKLGDVRLVVLDPLDSFIGSNVDIFKGNTVRTALWPLRDWCDRTGVTALIVHHLNKSPSTVALDRVSGARSFGAIPRSVWLVGADPDAGDDVNRSVLVPLKWNMSRKRPPSTSYEIKPSQYDPDIPTVAWLRDESDVSAEDLLTTAKPDDDSAKAAGIDFINMVLGGGKLPTKEVKRLASEAGVSWRTVERAAKHIGCVSQPVKDDKHRITHWEMALSSAQAIVEKQTPEPPRETQSALAGCEATSP